MIPAKCSTEIRDLKWSMRFDEMKEKTRLMAIIVCARDYTAIPEVGERLHEMYDEIDIAAVKWVDGSEPWAGSLVDKIACDIVRMAHEVY